MPIEERIEKLIKLLEVGPVFSLGCRSGLVEIEEARELARAEYKLWVESKVKELLTKGQEDEIKDMD